MRCTLLVLALLVLPFTSRAAERPLTDAEFTQLRQKVHAKLDELRTKAEFPGATVGFVLADGRSGSVSVGLADVENKVPLKPTDRMLAGSIGKTFVAAVFLQLVEEGKAGLDDKLSKWLGEELWYSRLPNGKDLTLRHLLNHQSGLPEYFEMKGAVEAVQTDPDRVWTPAERIAYVLDAKPQAVAGAKYAYADTNYILVGMVAERVAGKPLYDEVTRRLLTPLKLERTVPSDRRVIADLIPGYSMPNSPFGFSGSTIRDGKFVVNPQFEWAGGGFASTPEDLARWAKLLYGGDVLKPETRKAMLTGVDASSGRGGGKGTRYGFAVQIRESEWGTSYGHGGWFPGYLSEVEYYPKYGVAIAVQFNTDTRPAIKKGLRAYIADVARIVLTGDFAQQKQSNWHHWRGPNADGTAPTADPPTTWDAASGKNIKWKAELPGRGSATPIVWGDRVFVLTAIKTDREATAAELPKPDPRFQKKTDPPKHFYKFVVLCFDRNTGEKKWEKVAAEKVPHEGHHNTHSYAAGSPTTDGERLYAAFGSFGVFCYDFDGNQKWRRELPVLHTRLAWGEAVNAVVHDGSLLLNWDQEADSALYCLDAKTGEQKWKAERQEKSTWTTPLVTEFNGRTQVILNGTTRIRSHDLKTGEVIWSIGGMTVNPIPSAVLVGDSVVVMSGYNGAAAVAVPLNSTGDATPIWKTAKGTPYVPSPVVVGDRVYFTGRNENLLTVLDAKTGKTVIDSARLPDVRNFYASPIYAGGRVYFMDRTGTCLVLKPGDTLDTLATNRLNDPVDASPVAVGKQLFLRGEKYLYCIEEK